MLYEKFTTNIVAFEQQGPVGYCCPTAFCWLGGAKNVKLRLIGNRLGLALYSWSRSIWVCLVLAALALGNASCAMMPVDGPAAQEIAAAARGEAPAALPYALVPVTTEVISVLSRYAPRLSTAFSDRSPPKSFRFGIGDIVSVTIFKSAAGGLFTAESEVRAGNYVTVPNQAVDEHGNITVPYAGEIRARSRTPSEIQRDITARLKDRALEPQVLVALADQRTSLYSVLGDVHTAGRFPASPSGERILDAIARAGGPGNQGYDVWVALERAGHRASIPFGALMYEPANNIFVQPNDVIFVFNQPQTFVAFGAGGAQGLFRFDAWRLSLAEALAKQGGLNDNQADPASVYLYRGETRDVARQLGVDVGKFNSRIIPIISDKSQGSLGLFPRPRFRDAKQGRRFQLQRLVG